ncbi:TetR family transcriptional regulator [Actinomadura sp. 9N215]|uniref:TetR/AcrR family transcriptional regulator n=1 Tax=Actinomadura sp. 9N215 TaxID=3375150 RepID=UPI0037940DAF
MRVHTAETKSAPPAIDSRSAILQAARHLFAERGYQGVSVRAIAMSADVDPALIHYYHSTKAEIFQAVIEDIRGVPSLAVRILAARPDGMSTRLVGTFLDLWESPGAREPLLAMARSVASHEDARRLLTDLTIAGCVRQVVPGMGVSDPDLRIELVTSLLLGAAVMRYVLRIEPLASAGRHTLIADLAAAVDALLVCDVGTFHS